MFLSDIQEMLKLKTWAVVGATDNQEKFGYKIFRCMKAAGYEVYPVNPGVEEVMGEHCYPTLADLPVRPEAVDLVVNRRVGVKVVEQCAELGIENIWMQPGANAENVVALAKEKGLKVIHDACIMTEILYQKG
ncbi:MAG: CoA-binding domain protein [Firmicutes bacterium]|nr:CoA-binding domain protein [Bacillota bacterium]